MTPIQRADHKSNWNRTLTLCAAIGFPICGVAFALIVGGTKVLDRLTSLEQKVDKQDIRLNKIDENWETMFKVLNGKVDRVSQKQHDDSLLARKYLYYHHASRYPNGWVSMHRASPTSQPTLQPARFANTQNK